MKKILTTGLTGNTRIQFEKNIKLVEPDISLIHFEDSAHFVKKVEEESPVILVVRLTNEKNELIDSLRKIKSDAQTKHIFIVILFDENDFIGNPGELLRSCDGLLSLPFKTWEVISLFRLLLRSRQKNGTGSTLTNISEQGTNQINLMGGEEQFRNIVDGAPDPIFIQTDMKFAYLNSAACSLFGINSASELIDKPVMERFHPDFHEKIKCRIHHLNDLKQSVTGLFKQKFIRMDGSEVWVETTCKPISYYGKNGAIVFVRDISKRKESEKMLKESEIRFHSSLDSMLEGCQIIGFDWNYLYLNEAAVKQSHHKKDDLTGNNFVELWPEIEKTELFKNMKFCMKKRIPVHMDNLFNYPDGKTGWFELSIQPVPEGIFILSMDITERKISDENIKRLKEELEIQVGDKTRELQERVVELERFQEATIEREFRIKELRDEIEKLKK